MGKVLGKADHVRAVVDHGVNLLRSLDRFLEDIRDEFGESIIYLVFFAYLAEREEKD